MQSLSELYSSQTGLNSCYVRRYTVKGKQKQELVFTRKYTWHLETIIKQIHNCCVETALSSPLKTIEQIHQIINGETNGSSYKHT